MKAKRTFLLIFVQILILAIYATANIFALKIETIIQNPILYLAPFGLLLLLIDILFMVKIFKSNTISVAEEHTISSPEPFEMSSVSNTEINFTSPTSNPITDAIETTAPSEPTFLTVEPVQPKDPAEAPQIPEPPSVPQPTEESSPIQTNEPTVHISDIPTSTPSSPISENPVGDPVSASAVIFSKEFKTVSSVQPDIAPPSKIIYSKGMHPDSTTSDKTIHTHSAKVIYSQNMRADRNTEIPVQTDNPDTLDNN